MKGDGITKGGAEGDPHITPPPKQPEPTFTPEERDAIGIEIDEETKALQEAQDELDIELKKIDDQLEATRKSLTDAQNNIISSIRSTFATRIVQMQDLNKRSLASTKQFGISSGAFMRAGSFGGILTADEAKGIQRVANLEAQREGLIAQAELAIKELDIDMLLDSRNRIDKNLDDNKEALKEIQKLALERNKELEERKRFVTLAGVIDQLITAEDGVVSRSQMVQELLKAGSSIEEADKLLDILGEEEIKGTILELSDGTHILVNPFTGDTIKNFGDKTPIGGGLTGNVQRDADTIMAPFSGFKLSDVPTKDGYRALVGAELSNRREQAMKDGDIIGVIRASAGGKDIDATTIQSLEKAINVINQIATLQGLVEGEATGPIMGTIRSNNPFDKKAQIIKAQLSAIVPNLARGVYGEVGVLTDNDVRIYSRTLPNLKSEDEVRDAVLGLTILSVQAVC